MLKSYIKTAWRNIIKNPFYSLVNIIGLSAGIGFTLLIAADVWSEQQVNHRLKNIDRQYIIQSKWKNPNLGYELATLGPLAKELKERYPDLVKNYYRFDGITSNVSKGEKSFREGLQICDSTMLNMYGFKLLQGNPATALIGQFSVLLTKQVANKYFGKTAVVGETITIESFSGSKHDFLITGVLDDFSRNSVTALVDDYPNNFFISSTNLSFFGRNMDWTNSSIASYLELQDGVRPADLAKPIQYLVKQNTNTIVTENLTPYLTPLSTYYLTANNAIVKRMLYALSAIALFILGMAVINFINLSVSRSTTRMKEIGIRKVLGSLKRQLVQQFLAESIILVFLAMLFAVAIFILTKDFFSQIIGKNIPSLLQFPLYFVVFPVILVLLVGVIAGIYPAFVLSSLKSVESLKGKLSAVRDKVLLRKSLVAFQFGTATVVLVGAMIISQQIRLFFSTDLGYNKDFVVSAQVPRDWTPAGVKKMESIRRQFAALSQVENVTLSYEVPDGNNSGGAQLYNAGADSSAAISVTPLFTDEYYASTYNIPMVAGTFYGAPGTVTDSSKVVVNETAAKALGFKMPAAALGKIVRFPDNAGDFVIVGVAKDFHFGSMQKAIEPVTFLQVQLTTAFRFLSFKLKPGNIGNSLAALQKQWSLLMPGTAFEYKFMDDTLKKLYKTEIQLKQAAYTATALSLIIVLLGVIGLISLSVQKRTKEIGIRKVLGSSVTSILLLFIKEFTGAILLAGVIAAPLAYFLMKSWLSDYAYRVNITVTPFIVAITSLGSITVILILIQTIKTALANPVKSLRTE